MGGVGCAEAPVPRIAGDVNPVELGVKWSKAELVSGMFLATIGLAGGVGIAFSKRYFAVGFPYRVRCETCWE